MLLLSSIILENPGSAWRNHTFHLNANAAVMVLIFIFINFILNAHMECSGPETAYHHSVKKPNNDLGSPHSDSLPWGDPTKDRRNILHTQGRYHRWGTERKMDFLFCKYRRRRQLLHPSLSKGGGETFALQRKMKKVPGSYSNLFEYKCIFPRTSYISNLYDLEMSTRSLASFFLKM